MNGYTEDRLKRLLQWMRYYQDALSAFTRENKEALAGGNGSPGSRLKAGYLATVAEDALRSVQKLILGDLLQDAMAQAFCDERPSGQPHMYTVPENFPQLLHQRMGRVGAEIGIGSDQATVTLLTVAEMQMDAAEKMLSEAKKASHEIS